MCDGDVHDERRGRNTCRHSTGVATDIPRLPSDISLLECTTWFGVKCAATKVMTQAKSAKRKTLKFQLFKSYYLINS